MRNLVAPAPLFSRKFRLFFGGDWCACGWSLWPKNFPVQKMLPRKVRSKGSRVKTFKDPRQRWLLFGFGQRIWVFLFVCLFVFSLCLGWIPRTVRSVCVCVCGCCGVDDDLALPNVKHHWPKPAEGKLHWKKINNIYKLLKNMEFLYKYIPLRYFLILRLKIFKIRLKMKKYLHTVIKSLEYH